MQVTGIVARALEIQYERWNYNMGAGIAVWAPELLYHQSDYIAWAEGIISAVQVVVETAWRCFGSLSCFEKAIYRSSDTHVATGRDLLRLRRMY